MPCLYCDVSDSWLLKSRWRRIAIAAGGMIVELSLAATCTWLWWFSLPGFFNSLCFHVMVVCSVSTLLFNGNPLLKYDGYYIFSDLIAVPNLADKAQRQLYSCIGKTCLGIDLYTGQQHQKEKTGPLLTYAIAAIALPHASHCFHFFDPLPSAQAVGATNSGLFRHGYHHHDDPFLYFYSSKTDGKAKNFSTTIQSTTIDDHIGRCRNCLNRRVSHSAAAIGFCTSNVIGSRCDFDFC